MKIRTKIALISIAWWMSYSALPGEITITGSEPELREFLDSERTARVIHLKGVATMKIEPLGYQIEGEVYTRGKEYRTVKDENLSRLRSIESIAGEFPGASFVSSNTYTIASEDLAFAEMRELEYRDAFRIEVAEIDDVDAIIHRLSGIEGVILTEIVTLTRDPLETLRNTEAFWKALEQARADLERRVAFYEESLGVKLKVLNFESAVVLPFGTVSMEFREDIGVRGGLFPFAANVRRKPSERTVEAGVEKGFFEQKVMIELPAEYRIRSVDTAIPSVESQ